MKRLSLLMLTCALVVLVATGTAKAYTWSDVTGTQTLSEQSIDVSSDSLSYTQTLSNNDSIDVEAGGTGWPCSYPTYCPTNVTNGSVSSVVDTNTISADSIYCPGGTDRVGYHGTVSYKNHLGFLLWKYRQTVFLYFCPSLYPSQVTSIYKIISEPDYSQYGWTWEGTVAGPVHNPLPANYVQTYSKGFFNVCPLTKWLWCEDRYPWIKLSVNGYGHLYNVKWGIGS